MYLHSNRLRLALLALSAFVVASASASSDVRVIDGDTLELEGVTIRLNGIDAPEAGQSCARADGGRWPCGKRATAALEVLVNGKVVTCEPRGHDDYGRILSVCEAGGQEVNAALVRDGVAWSFRRYSHDYDELEDAAHAAGEGIWQAETEPPWAFRERRWTAALQVVPDKRCPIKGNINTDGERIYHAPWSPWYDRTKVNTAKGERWFCDEAEAVAAGWRAPYWGR
jgi:endonuclease YncB( thermonuclease family)